MTEHDVVGLDAVAMAEAVAGGEVTPAQLHRMAAARHEATHETINAIVEWYDEPSWGDPTGPLAGVPFLRKDYGSTEAGRLVEMGSALAEGVRAPRSSPYYERLAAAGITVVGRSAVPEFIQHGTTESRVFGPTRNPMAPDHSAGGSSGGAAAAVAAGVVPVAHASDCAGSIRIPAATCGLIGLKPSRRRVPWPDGGWGGIAEEFVVCRTIRDARAFWSVLADRPGPVGGPRRPRRIGLSTDHWAGASEEGAVVDAVGAMAARLASLGHEIVVIDGCPFDYDRSMQTWDVHFSRWVAAEVSRVSELTGRRVDAAVLEPITLTAIDRAARLTVDDVTAAQIIQGRVSHQLDVAMADLDLLLTPALGRSVIPLGVVGGEVDDFGVYLERNDALFPYSFVANLTGRPAIVVPTGRVGTEGAPLAAQLIGWWGSDEELLALAAEALDGA